MKPTYWTTSGGYPVSLLQSGEYLYSRGAMERQTGCVGRDDNCLWYGNAYFEIVDYNVQSRGYIVRLIVARAESKQGEADHG